jgi:hypothetical protein
MYGCNNTSTAVIDSAIALEKGSRYAFFKGTTSERGHL